MALLACPLFRTEAAAVNSTASTHTVLQSRVLNRVHCCACFWLRPLQVWFPDSADKTAQAIEEFDREGLPLFILANWRGFAGGQRDLFDGVLQVGEGTGCTRSSAGGLSRPALAAHMHSCVSGLM